MRPCSGDMPVGPMQACVADNQKGKRGTHNCDLAEYGLSKVGVRARFKSYIERYDIPVRG